MGDKYHWYEDCPNCGERMCVYCAESCGVNDVQCPKCKSRYEIVMTHKLVPIQGRGNKKDF